jgi:hypothetical protein
MLIYLSYLLCSLVVQASEVVPHSETELLSETVENDAPRTRPGAALLPPCSRRNHNEREKP